MSNLISEAVKVPRKVGSGTRDFDYGYLANVIGGLRFGGPISEPNEQIELLRRFAVSNDRALKYNALSMSGVSGIWLPSNCAYNNLTFEERSHSLPLGTRVKIPILGQLTSFSIVGGLIPFEENDNSVSEFRRDMLNPVEVYDGIASYFFYSRSPRNFFPAYVEDSIQRRRSDRSLDAALKPPIGGDGVKLKALAVAEDLSEGRTFYSLIVGDNYRDDFPDIF